MNEPLPKVDQMDENAKILRSMIEQENNLQNYRVTWLMTIQGLLFAALGFAWDKNDTRELIGLFCVLGLLVSLISWSALQLSGKAYHELVNWWNQHKPQNYNGPPIMGDTGRPNWLLWLLRPWRALPWIFALSWVTVFILNLQR